MEKLKKCLPDIFVVALFTVISLAYFLVPVMQGKILYRHDSQQTVRCNRTDFITGYIGDNEIIMQQCGIGKVNSALGAAELINHFQPDLIVSSGVAGGADTSLNVTDVVVGTQYVYHDAYCGSECEYGQIMGMPARFASPGKYVDIAMKASTSHGRITPT